MSTKKICGIDCSSTVVAYAILEEGNLIAYDYLKFNKNFSLVEKEFQFEKTILPKLIHYECDAIVLEDRLKSFSGGRTTNSTIMKLAHVNGVVEYLLCKTFGVENVHNIHPSTARKQAWGRAFPKDKSIDTKDWVVQNCMKTYNISFPVKERSRKDPKPFIDEAGDVGDAITLAKSYSLS